MLFKSIYNGVTNTRLNLRHPTEDYPEILAAEFIRYYNDEYFGKETSFGHLIVKYIQFNTMSNIYVEANVNNKTDDSDISDDSDEYVIITFNEDINRFTIKLLMDCQYRNINEDLNNIEMFFGEFMVLVGG
jgi:hypothetical protein